MPIPFQSIDRRILISALSDSRPFQSFKERWLFVNNILDDYPEMKKVLHFVDWDGSPGLVADDLVRRLEGHEVAPNIPALALIAQAIEPSAGRHQTAIADLRHRLGWGAELVSSPAKVWSDSRSSAEIVQEKIIGENTLHPMYYLSRALRAADAVVRVDVGGIPNGTGFLVGENLVMTNNHVIAPEWHAVAQEKDAQSMQAVFFNDVQDPEPGDQDKLRREVKARPAQKALLYTNKDLDFTFLRLEGCPPTPRLKLRPVVVEQNQRVMIIQHPGGYPKQISMQNNLVAFADERIVQYYTSTRAGSSGSPALDNDFAVIAIHHGVVHNEEWDSKEVRITDPEQIEDRQFRNQGTSMVAVVKDLERSAPHILKELAIVGK